MNFTRSHTQNRNQDLRTETYLLGAKYVFHDHLGWQSIDPVSKLTRLSTRGPRNRCFIAAGEKPFYFQHQDQVVIHPASYLMGTRDGFDGLKAAGSSK